MSTTPLFDEQSPFDRAKVAARLRQLASENVWIGSSSWKYEGWMGQVYTRERYLARGRFSQKSFADTCLREYAETFPIVCGDFSFYQFPSEAYWQRLFRSAPAELRYTFKAPEDVTVRVFPAHDRYGSRAGVENPSYLDASLFQDAFLAPLEPYRRQIPVLIFEFGAFSKKVYPHVSEFVKDLDRFLSAVPKTFRYSVEVRNPDFLAPEYFQCLRTHGVAHVFNAWARMPELHRQMALREAFTADFMVCRALLSQGRAYEQAVKKFSPYQAIQEPYPEARQAMHTLIQRTRSDKQAAYIFVNNRLEGNAPQTIQAIVEDA
jgi:uncharacterized protein YecE (DUF72 family)